MNRELRLDKLSKSDLIDIWRYSFKEWGEAQADHYLNILEKEVLKIWNSPESGTHRELLHQGYWSICAEKHIVFYTFDENEVRIRRVLHASMGAGLHL